MTRNAQKFLDTRTYVRYASDMADDEMPPAGGGGLSGDLSVVDDNGLAEHICSFASRISAATCLFLLAIAEYDRRRAWAAWECRSMVEWLSWHCRTSRVTAAQYCRTATALLSLPVIRDRFSTGALSYSQVRALVKVATPANEEMLVEWAACMTANQLERVTATYQRCRAAAEQTARERDRRRTLNWGYEEDGSVTGMFRLAPEHAAVVIKAISQRVVPVDPDAPDAADETSMLDPVGARRADALVEMAAADLGGRAADEATDAGDRYLVTIVADESVLRTREPDRDSCDGEGPRSKVVEARASSRAGSPSGPHASGRQAETPARPARPTGSSGPNVRSWTAPGWRPRPSSRCCVISPSSG